MTELKNKKLYISNVLLFLCIGTGISAWLLYHTELFSVIGGVFGFGGILAWAAFFTKIIREERQKAFAEWIDQSVLSSCYTTLALIFIVVGLLLCASTLGSIMVSISPGLASKQITITPLSDSNSEGKSIRFLANSTTSIREKLKSGFLKSQRYRATYNDYQTYEFDVSSWSRTEIFYPENFKTQPALLIRPAIDLYGQVEHGGVTLLVCVNDILLLKDHNYNGYAFWLGVKSSTTVPEKLVADWKEALALAGKNIHIANRWSKLTDKIKETLIELKPNSRVDVAFVLDQDKPWAGNNYTVGEGISIKHFPNELIVQLGGKVECKS